MSRQSHWVLLFALWSFGLVGYTWKDGRKRPPPSFAPPPYMALVRQALVARQLQAATRLLKGARRCWSQYREACGFQKYEYLTFGGVLMLQRSQSKQAIQMFGLAQRSLTEAMKKHKAAQHKHQHPTKQEALIRARKWRSYRQTQDSLSFYLGQALYRSHSYKEAAEALTRAAGLGQKLPGYHRLLALCWQKAGVPTKARRVLSAALKRFPQNRLLLRSAALLYVELGLWQVALGVARRLLVVRPKKQGKRRTKGPKKAKKNLVDEEKLRAFLVVIDAMRQAKLVHQLLPLLEEARLQFPMHRGVLLRLASTYSRAQMHLAAARSFAALARKEPKMAYFAAAAYLQAGQLSSALRWNLLVPEPKRAFQQRVSILLKQRAFARVFGLLLPRWRKKTLSASLTYQLAYVCLQMGRFSLAQMAVNTLRGTAYNNSAKQLAPIISRCRQSPWLCAE